MSKNDMFFHNKLADCASQNGKNNDNTVKARQARLQTNASWDSPSKNASEKSPVFGVLPIPNEDLPSGNLT
jgi:hypothetical protein